MEDKSLIAENVTKKTENNTVLGKIISLFYEISALFFWVYSIIQIFFFDIDEFIIKLLSLDFVWIIKYKFFVLISIIAITWIFTKNKSIIPWFIFVVFYPFIIILWKIPKLIFKTKNWIVVIAGINLVISFFRSVKYKFIISASCLISICLILTSSNKVLVYISAIILFSSLVIVFINRFILVFRPSSLYGIHLKLVVFITDYTKKTWLPGKDTKELTIEQMNDNQIQQWSNNLQMSIIVNRVCLFLSTKIKEYQKSKAQIIFDILSLLWLVFIMIFFFSLINMALYKFNPTFYTYSQTPSLFLFIYYSLSSLYGNNIREIVAVSNYTRGVFMLETIFSFVLVGLLFTLFLSTKSERNSMDTEDYADKLRQQGKEIENFISSEYKLSIDQAMFELEKLKAGLIKFIYYLSGNI